MSIAKYKRLRNGNGEILELPFEITVTLGQSAADTYWQIVKILVDKLNEKHL